MPDGSGYYTNPTRKRGVFDFREWVKDPSLARRVSVLDLPRRSHFFRAKTRKSAAINPASRGVLIRPVSSTARRARAEGTQGRSCEVRHGRRAHPARGD